MFKRTCDLTGLKKELLIPEGKNSIISIAMIIFGVCPALKGMAPG